MKYQGDGSNINVHVLDVIVGIIYIIISVPKLIYCGDHILSGQKKMRS